MNIWKQVKKIVGLRWDETSGVDHAATLEDGFAVIKSADVPDHDDLEAISNALGIPMGPTPVSQDGSGWIAYKNVDVLEPGCDSDGEVALVKCRDEETDMTKQEDPEFLAFKDRIQGVMKSLPTDDDRERFLSLLSEAVGNRNEAVIKGEYARQFASVLTKAAARFASADKERLLDMLHDALQKDLGEGDPQLDQMRLVVAKSLVKARLRKCEAEAEEDSMFSYSSAGEGGVSEAGKKAAQAIRQWGPKGDAPESLRK
jgi:hypothetical protein